jgi:hypothetical protein
MQAKPGSPRVEQNSALKGKINAAMANFYKAKSKALDISRFHTDPGGRMVIYNTQTYTEF